MAGFMHSPTLSSALSLHGLRRSNQVKVLDLNLGFGVKNSRKRVVPLDSPQAYRGRTSRLRINVVAAAATSTVELKEKEKDKEKGKEEEKLSLVSFADPKWKKGSWDIQQFTKDGNVDWDAVIDAEVRRRKWLEDNPEASSNSEPVVFDTSIVPWWAWVKRFHLPQAELLNGRAAMVGFFMAYAVDSLTGIGLVDQMSSFLGKLFLFIAVTGVLVIRKNEDIANLKQIVKEFNLYDKQWQATWQDEKPENMGKDS